MRRSLLFILTNSLLCGSLAVSAGQVTTEGVVSIGYLAPSANTFVNEEPGKDAVLSENVFRITYTGDSRVAVSTQVVYREAGDYYESEPSIDFLQLDFRASWFDDSEQTVTIGRHKSRQGLYNESRDVPFTRPSILLPQSVYLDSTRNFQLSADGFRLNSFHSLEESDISFGVAVGKSVLDDQFSRVTLGKTATGDWDSDNNKYADFRWESQNWTLGFSFADVALQYQPAPGAYLPFEFNGIVIPVPLMYGAFDATFATLSMQYRQANWELTVEHIDRNFDVEGFTAPNNRTKSEMDGYYAQLRYFFNDELVGLLRYDAMDISNSEDINNPAWSKDAKRARDITIGLLWNINESWQLSIEQHFIDGGAWIPPISKTSTDSSLRSSWNLSAVQISYKF